MSIERRADKHVKEIIRIFHQRNDEFRREVALKYISNEILPDGFDKDDLNLAAEILWVVLR